MLVGLPPETISFTLPVVHLDRASLAIQLSSIHRVCNATRYREVQRELAVPRGTGPSFRSSRSLIAMIAGRKLDQSPSISARVWSVFRPFRIFGSLALTENTDVTLSGGRPTTITSVTPPVVHPYITSLAIVCPIEFGTQHDTAKCNASWQFQGVQVQVFGHPVL